MPHDTILIIRPGALGDTILTLPLVASIQAKNPDCPITFLGNRACKDLFPASVAFQPFDDPAWLWLFNLEHAAMPDTVQRIDRAYAILSRPEDVLRNLRRVGVRSILQCPAHPGPGQHMVEYLHEALELTVPAREPALIDLAPVNKKDFIWIHPGSGGASKCLPLEIMYELARHLAELTGWNLMVSASEEDAFLKRNPLWERLTETDAASVMIQRPLKDLCAEFGAARLFLGSDSGIAHLAAALGVPSAVFFLKSDPANWGPWAPDNQVRILDLRGEDVENFAIDRALSRIESLLR